MLSFYHQTILILRCFTHKAIIYYDRHPEKVDEYITCRHISAMVESPTHQPPQLSPLPLKEFLCHDQLQYNEGSER